MSIETEVDDDSRAPDTSIAMDRRQRAVAVGLVALVVLTALGLVLRWWLTAPAFGGISYEAQPEVGSPAPLGRTSVASLVVPDHLLSGPVELDITSARPLIVSNSSHASVRIVLCRRRGYVPSVGAEPLAAAVRDTCMGIHPFRTGHYVFSKRSPDIGLEIRPRTKGRVVIAGIQLTYWRGLRHGHELVGYAIGLHTP